MSVLINGIEMPKEGTYNIVHIYSDGHVSMPFWGKGMQIVQGVDAVEVVRCKDCRHRDPEDHKCDSGEMERQGCPFKVADDYFCAYGERRSE